ncbi:MAG: hypothetical protein HFH41_04010 [Lachnospiraceae bacterium]|nr:hypothetical protein [Lachnospiraceae bacterium]
MNKEKIDRIINAIAALSVIIFLIGAIIAIWIGTIGIKILLSAVVVFLGDYAVSFWKQQCEKEKK